MEVPTNHQFHHKPTILGYPHLIPNSQQAAATRCGGPNARMLKSGRRPRARVLPGGPSVTNRRLQALRTLPPTHPRPTRGPPQKHWWLFNLQWILRVVFKNIGFYGVSGSSAATDLSWRCSKTVVFTWFWTPGRGKNRKSWHLEGVSR